MRRSIHIMISPTWRWSTLFVLIAIGVTIRLGIWQVDRHYQRRDLITRVNMVIDSPEIVLSEGIPDIDFEANEFRKIQATGEFDFNYQIGLRNQVWVQPWGNDPGFSLFAPLVLSNGHAVLIQRGWIPLEFNSPELWREFDKKGITIVHGVIRNPILDGGMGGGIADPTYAPGESMSFFWNSIDINHLERLMPYKLLPIYIQQSPDPLLKTYPYAKPPEIDLSEGTHMGYALQWFAYSILILIIYLILINRQNNEILDKSFDK